MNSCDLFYEVELPDYFTLDHPHGTVMEEQNTLMDCLSLNIVLLGTTKESIL